MDFASWGVAPGGLRVAPRFESGGGASAIACYISMPPGDGWTVDESGAGAARRTYEYKP